MRWSMGIGREELAVRGNLYFLGLEPCRQGNIIDFARKSNVSGESGGIYLFLLTCEWLPNKTLLKDETVSADIHNTLNM
jgi:hypothetical protein